MCMNIKSIGKAKQKSTAYLKFSAMYDKDKVFIGKSRGELIRKERGALAHQCAQLRLRWSGHSPWCLRSSVVMGSWSETVVLLLVAVAAVPCSSLIKEKDPGKGKCFH